MLPDADVKIYLDAAPEARAKRRMLQNEEKGIEEPYEEVLAAIIERDARDKTARKPRFAFPKTRVFLIPAA